MATNNAINNTLPTPFTVGATSVTSTGTQLNYLNGLTAVPINKVIKQIITSTGTYTPTTGTQYLIVELLAGGGSGGGCAASGAAQAGSASGGAGGGYSRRVLTISQVVGTASVTIGTGGAAPTAGANNGNAGNNSSFIANAGAGATLLSCTGGAGGILSAANVTVAASLSSAPRAGGNGANGDVNVTGGPSAGGICFPTASVGIGSNGGSTIYGAGGIGVQNGAGGGGSSYGAGGAGGASGNSAATAGGAGADGVCIITEYVSS